ncbi:hypothetical protein CUJ83_11860 [Methanocella sp. CWC-04]|uniref:Uncharacterized protein n=1 Tax=Methanooceanicella nereidis TaxID=2052831 RepID=A0AAP2W6T8_9EURY|nr:hypothetical protein [Methanocella sp. CWC-04]
MGSWTITIQLNREKLSAYGNGYLTDILVDMMGIMGDIFVVTRVECPYKYTLFDRIRPITPGSLREALEKRWEMMGSKDSDFSPNAMIYGLTYVYAFTVTGMSRALIPNALSFRLDSEIKAEEPMATLTVSTNCDIWMEETINGADNSIMGTLNGDLLSEKLEELEKRLSGKITSYGTGFDDVIRMNKYGLRKK